MVFAGPSSFVYDRRDFSFCSTVTTAMATRWVRGLRSTFSKTSMKNLRLPPAGGKLVFGGARDESRRLLTRRSETGKHPS